MPSHRGAGGLLVEPVADPSVGSPADGGAGALVDDDGRRSRAGWPNSREDRFGGSQGTPGPSAPSVPGSRSGSTSTGRRAAVPAQRSTALATHPSGPHDLTDLTDLHDLAALLGVPGQRSAPPRAFDLPPSHPSAPVPAPVAPPGWTSPAPRTGGTDALSARRRSRAASVPAQGGSADVAAPARSWTPAPAAPSAFVPSSFVPSSRPAPAVASPVAPAEPATRRSRRAALVPVDAQPRTAEPARPGSRRALREQQEAPSASGTARAVEALQDGWAAPSESDTDVLARLEALLSAPLPSREPAAAAPAPSAPSGLDLRTDPLLPRVGWSRHTPVEPSPALAPSPAAPVAPVPSAHLLASPAPVAAPAPVFVSVSAPVTAAVAVAEALRLSDVEEAPAAFVPRRGRRAHRLPKRARVALPQVAVVGVLGVATLVAPLVGTHLRAEADTGASTSSSADAGASTAQAAAAAGAAGAVDLLAGRTSEALSRSAARDDAALQATTDRAAQAKATADAAAQAAADLAAQQQAQAEADAKAAADHQAAVAALVGDCSGQRPDTDGDRNGRLPSSQLCGLWVGGHQLRSDAAVAFAELDLAYRSTSAPTWSSPTPTAPTPRRSRCGARSPAWPRVPGTSEHGWGLAVDLGGGVEDSDEHYAWLIENAPKHGWDHPAWARKGGGGPLRALALGVRRRRSDTRRRC